ncbi:ATPase [Streptococcus bovimastitidis]|uniref:ATPase n=1 Tax=Streptococcus bovimastitidis TaxID=1856638 RepID=A0A1L8MKF8_9STRE|nr:ATPase [Streptococcus bovimastitidis]OJF71257.1 ATPase [Streptococcus bovimastitidis]
MNIDITAISQWCTALVAIIVFLKYVSAPIKIVLENNKRTMESLQDSIEKLADGLKENQFNFKMSAEDRKDLRRVQNQHESRIGIAEDKLISHDERLNFLEKEKSK